MRHVTHMNESCHKYKWSHVTHMNDQCHPYAEDMSQLIADRVAQHLEIISKKKNLVPGVPGFSRDLLFITWY